MFLRKLTVIVLPLLALWGLTALSGALGGLGSWGEAGLGILSGLGLALLPMLAGEGRGRLPFGRLLFIPAGLLLILMIMQILTHEGGVILPLSLQARDFRTLLMEGIACGALTGGAVRG